MRLIRNIHRDQNTYKRSMHLKNKLRLITRRHMRSASAHTNAKPKIFSPRHWLALKTNVKFICAHVWGTFTFPPHFPGHTHIAESNSVFPHISAALSLGSCFLLSYEAIGHRHNAVEVVHTIEIYVCHFLQGVMMQDAPKE